MFKLDAVSFGQVCPHCHLSQNKYLTLRKVNVKVMVRFMYGDQKYQWQWVLCEYERNMSIKEETMTNVKVFTGIWPWEMSTWRSKPGLCMVSLSTSRKECCVRIWKKFTKERKSYVQCYSFVRDGRTYGWPVWILRRQFSFQFPRIGAKYHSP